MCHYCGCREIPLIKDFIAEHERVTDLAGSMVRLLDIGDLDAARACFAELARELRLHWRGEEDGLFAVMSRDPEYRDYVRALEDEHRDMSLLLSTGDLADPRYRAQVIDAVKELDQHIGKEENGLFPASLTALSGDQWNTAMEAWHTAHS